MAGSATVLYTVAMMDAARLERFGISERQWTAALAEPGRIVALDTGRGRYWLKKVAPARGTLRYWFLDRISQRLGAPLLAAVPQPGGRQALATEARRLRELAAAGIRVPELLYESPDQLLISDLGVKLTRWLASRQPVERLDMLDRVFAALEHLHRQGQYLSQAFARNVMVLETGGETGIGFIDFEDDPLSVMSLADAQGRDLLLLIYSLGRYFRQQPEAYLARVRRQVERQPAAVRAQYRRLARGMRWLTRIPLKKNGAVGRLPDFVRLLDRVSR